jgi:Holliday junction resolvase
MADGELRKIFRKHLAPRGFDLASIETGGSEGGVPDMNGCRGGVEFWCEMKRAEHWRCKIRPAQVGWIERRLRAGGRVFIAVRRDDTELWLYHGAAIRRLTDTRLDMVPSLGHWSGGAARWDWDLIEGMLTA